jgi:ribosome-binding factor A
MQGKRLDRVNQLVREEISYLLQRELKDPRLGFVTVTEVQVAKDLRTAKVYVSVLGTEAEWQASLAALERARGFIRNWLTPRLRLRAVPHLTFHADRSMAHAAHIQTVLERLRAEEADRQGADVGRSPGAVDPE